MVVGVGHSIEPCKAFTEFAVGEPHTTRSPIPSERLMTYINRNSDETPFRPYAEREKCTIKIPPCAHLMQAAHWTVDIQKPGEIHRREAAYTDARDFIAEDSREDGKYTSTQGGGVLEGMRFTPIFV